MSTNIFQQLRKDPILSARYLGWIRDKKGRKIPFFPNEMQVKLRNIKLKAYASRKRPLFQILKARRLGITTSEQWENLNLSLFEPNKSVVTIAHEQESTQLIFNIAKFFYDNLPTTLKSGKTKSNKRELIFSHHNSSFYIGTAGSTSFGRGQTLQKAHGSEVAFWPGTTDEIDNLILGIQEAASEGEVVLESTANGRDNWFYESWVAAKKGKTAWIPVFFAWFEDPTYTVPNPTVSEIQEITETLDDEEKDLITRNNVSINQLLWRRSKIRELKNKRKFDQEYPKDDITAFLVSGHTFFDIQILEKLLKLIKPNIPLTESLIAHNEDIVYWYPPDPNEQYTAASDIAGGSVNDNSDYSVTTIMDSKYRQVARLRTKMAPDEFARFNCNRFLPQFNMPMWGIERNNHGHSVINTAYNECNYPQLWRSMNYLTGKIGDIGFQTDRRTRPMMLDSLSDFMHDIAWNKTIGIINDDAFIAECFDFVDHGKNKYEAAEGKHDDTLIAWAINLQVANNAGAIDIRFV